MVVQVEVKNKRTFYSILQVSDDADIDAIIASYQRLRSKYEGIGDAEARNELNFINHAFETLSDSGKRNLYDRQIGSIPASSTIQYGYADQPGETWFASSKLFLLMAVVLAIIVYGLKNNHTEEVSKITVSKEAVVGDNEAKRIDAENKLILYDGTVKNVSKAIDKSAEIAERSLEIKRQEAEIRRMEAENRIKINEASLKQRNEAKKVAEERRESCEYLRSLIDQANRAGAYEEARALQSRGC